MSRDYRGILGKVDVTSDEVLGALTQATRAALREHKRLGVPAVMWDQENDWIIEVPPEEIDVEDEPAEQDEDAGANGAHP
ncbi:MAG TPA: hypothetical protein VG406_29740 [Isosphaeraceae bacterium]|jgi:hypothetical protein|nr:hypothetical protein [Isosphaeraceae bacterium]